MKYIANYSKGFTKHRNGIHIPDEWVLSSQGRVENQGQLARQVKMTVTPFGGHRRNGYADLDTLFPPTSPDYSNEPLYREEDLVPDQFEPINSKISKLVFNFVKKLL